MGIVMSGFGFSGLMIVPATRIIDSFGWRNGMAIMGIGVFVLCIPLSLIVRGRPEQYGLLPDGDGAVDRAAVKKEGTKDKKKGDTVSFKRYLKSYTFWLIAVALALQNLVLNGVIAYVMPYMSNIGISRDIGSIIAAMVPIGSTIGRFGFGWLSDRVKNKTLTFIGFILMAAGMLCFSFAASSFLLVVLFLVFFGIGFGDINTMRAILPRTYFGRRDTAPALAL